MEDITVKHFGVFFSRLTVHMTTAVQTAATLGHAVSQQTHLSQRQDTCLNCLMPTDA